MLITNICLSLTLVYDLGVSIINGNTVDGRAALSMLASPSSRFSRRAQAALGCDISTTMVDASYTENIPVASHDMRRILALGCNFCPNDILR